MLTLRTARESLPIRVVVCDLDRTITDARLRVVPSALQALRRLRKSGARTILATGRRPRELRSRTSLLAAFDGLILEGGGLVGRRGRLESTTSSDALLADLAHWLRKQRISYDGGATILSLDRRHVEDLGRFPLRGRLQVLRNRDRIDVTPRGVDKGTGLRRLLGDHAPERRGRILAFADGENDLPLFREAHHRVAVANAAPIVRRRADEVTRHPGGRGVAEFIRTRLLQETHA